jgi:hypothetical protein
VDARGLVRSKGRRQPVAQAKSRATKAKTPARTQGFFQFQMVAPSGIVQVFNRTSGPEYPSSLTPVGQFSIGVNRWRR